VHDHSTTAAKKKYKKQNLYFVGVQDVQHLSHAVLAVPLSADAEGAFNYSSPPGDG